MIFFPLVVGAAMRLEVVVALATGVVAFVALLSGYFEYVAKKNRVDMTPEEELEALRLYTIKRLEKMGVDPEGQKNQDFGTQHSQIEAMRDFNSRLDIINRYHPDVAKKPDPVAPVAHD